MYIPKIYRTEEREVIEEFIRQNGFVTIVSYTNSHPFATHILFDLQGNEA